MKVSLEGSGQGGTPNLVKSHWGEPLPPKFGDRRELLGRLLVHTRGVIRSELVSGHALVDITRPVHARNVGDARERRAVSSKGRSTVKWD